MSTLKIQVQRKCSENPECIVIEDDNQGYLTRCTECGEGSRRYDRLIDHDSLTYMISLGELKELLAKEDIDTV